MKQSPRPVGEILVERGVLDDVALQRLLGQQAADPARPRLCSLALAGRIGDEDALVGALAQQLGVPGAALTRSVLDLAVLDRIPVEIAQRYSMLPVALEQDRLSVAMADPLKREVLDEVQFVTGTRVVAYVGLKSMIDGGILSAYAAHAGGRRDLLAGPRAAPSSARPGGQVAEVLPQAALVLPVEIEFSDENLAEPAPAPAAAAPPPAEPLPTAMARPDRAKARILVVDDEEDIRTLLATALRKAGYEVLLAERGLEALQAVKAEAPDLLLLDAMLPEVHGFEICQKVKTSRRFGHIPVIMITAVYRGWRFAHDVKKTYGADDYIEKPFLLTDVLRRVEDQLVRASKLARFETPDEAEIEELRRRGHQAHKAGQHEQALEIYRLAVEMEPFDARLHFMLAMSLQGVGQTFSAIYEFERAAELDPALFPALKNLAVLYERRGFAAKAAEMWERALLHAKEDQKASIRSHLHELLG